MGAQGRHPAPAPEGYRTDAAGGTAPARNERDLIIETQKQEGEASELAPRPQRAPARETAPAAPLPAPQPAEENVLAQLPEIPELRHDRRFREGARRLLAEGIPAAELARVVRIAAQDGAERGGLSFIADRFPRWQRKAREGERRRAPVSRHELAELERQRAEERARIREEQETPEGRAEIAAALARLPWRR